MGRFGDIVTLIVFVGLATAMLLPGRQTPQVINAAGTQFQGALGTAIKG